MPRQSLQSSEKVISKHQQTSHTHDISDGTFGDDLISEGGDAKRLLRWGSHGSSNLKSILQLQAVVGNRATIEIIRKHRSETNLQRKINQSSLPLRWLPRIPPIIGEKQERGIGATSIQSPSRIESVKHIPSGMVQRKIYGDMDEMWAGVLPDANTKGVMKIINKNPQLGQAYNDIENNIGHMNFQYQEGVQPVAASAPREQGGDIYDINFGRPGELENPYNDEDRYVGAILHEMMHINAALQYSTNVAPGGLGHMSNMNLPAPQGQDKDREYGMTNNQFEDDQLGMVKQRDTMNENWDTLRALVNDSKGLKTRQKDYLNARIDYAQNVEFYAHYDTVLMDILYYLVAEKSTKTNAYRYASRMMEEANQRRSTGEGAVARIEP